MIVNQAFSFVVEEKDDLSGIEHNYFFHFECMPAPRQQA